MDYKIIDSMIITVTGAFSCSISILFQQVLVDDSE